MSIALVTTAVLAHIAPSPTENNRYAKVELRHDAVRLVYTIYFGERPGAGERRQIDRNGDGTIDDGESRDFAAAIVAQVGPFLTVELDGKPGPAPWVVADVGLGTPSASGGSFSVDMTLEARLAPAASGEHTLWLEDLWPVPFPGETEVRVEAAPGVDLLASHPRRDGKGVMVSYRYRGLATAGQHGMWMRFRVDAARSELPAPPPAMRTQRSRRWIWWALIGMGGVAIAGLARWRMRRTSGR
jgi:hypothetical protein